MGYRESSESEAEYANYLKVKYYEFTCKGTSFITRKSRFEMNNVYPREITDT